MGFDTTSELSLREFAFRNIELTEYKLKVSKGVRESHRKVEQE